VLQSHTTIKQIIIKAVATYIYNVIMLLREFYCIDRIMNARYDVGDEGFYDLLACRRETYQSKGPQLILVVIIFTVT
jgi:hypothetical protein